ncbi:MAG: hypothetical protein OEQ29_03760, partial [Alphaproteobacteria bacterium]|nr:hypothetical protein [Alphaproteobacteria bacterium]
WQAEETRRREAIEARYRAEAQSRVNETENTQNEDHARALAEAEAAHRENLEQALAQAEAEHEAALARALAQHEAAWREEEAERLEAAEAHWASAMEAAREATEHNQRLRVPIAANDDGPMIVRIDDRFGQTRRPPPPAANKGLMVRINDRAAS